jgi:type IV pilus assembly protein PilM
MSINYKEVNLAIPSYSSFITLVDVPGKKDSEIEKELKRDIGKHIPVDLKEVVYDWKIIDFKNENELNQKSEESKIGLEENISNEKKVLLVSTTRSVSNEYEKSFEKNNFKINSIEVDCFSTQRALLGDNKPGNYLIIDIGSKVTNFIGVMEGQLIFNRNIDLAGNKLTELISKTLKISRDRAEILKIKQGLKTDSKEVYENIFKPFCDSIVEQAQKRIEEFNTFESDRILKKIILSGGGSEITGLKGYLKDELGVEIVYGNPWSKIDYPKELEDKILSYSPFFSVAVGLALIDLE